MNLYVIIGAALFAAVIFIIFELKNAPVFCNYCGEMITGKGEQHYCNGKLEAIRSQKPFEGTFKGKVKIRPFCPNCGLEGPLAVVYDRVTPGIRHKLLFLRCPECEKKRKINEQQTKIIKRGF